MWLNDMTIDKVRHMTVASGMKICVKRVHVFVTNENEFQTIRNKAKCLEMRSYNKEWETKRVSVFMSVLHIIADLCKCLIGTAGTFFLLRK